jgi:hypothetical protein
MANVPTTAQTIVSSFVQIIIRQDILSLNERRFRTAIAIAVREGRGWLSAGGAEILTEIERSRTLLRECITRFYAFWDAFEEHAETDADWEPILTAVNALPADDRRNRVFEFFEEIREFVIGIDGTEFPEDEDSDAGTDLLDEEEGLLGIQEPEDPVEDEAEDDNETLAEDPAETEDDDDDDALSIADRERRPKFVVRIRRQGNPNAITVQRTERSIRVRLP